MEEILAIFDDIIDALSEEYDYDTDFVNALRNQLQDILEENGY